RLQLEPVEHTRDLGQLFQGLLAGVVVTVLGGQLEQDLGVLDATGETGHLFEDVLITGELLTHLPGLVRVVPEIRGGGALTKLRQLLFLVLQVEEATRLVEPAPERRDQLLRIGNFYGHRLRRPMAALVLLAGAAGARVVSADLVARLDGLLRGTARRGGGFDALRRAGGL